MLNKYLLRTKKYLGVRPLRFFFSTLMMICVSLYAILNGVNILYDLVGSLYVTLDRYVGVKNHIVQ